MPTATDGKKFHIYLAADTVRSVLTGEKVFALCGKKKRLTRESVDRAFTGNVCLTCSSEVKRQIRGPEKDVLIRGWTALLEHEWRRTQTPKPRPYIYTYRVIPNNEWIS